MTADRTRSKPRRGRPPLPDGEVLQVHSMRFKRSQWQRIERFAAASQLSVTEYVRRRALQERIGVRRENRQA